MQGGVYGGRQPITGAMVLAYAAGTTTGALPSEIGAAVTDSSGRFTMTFSPAPATSQIVYVTVGGGNAGGGYPNGAIGLMTVAGAYCDSDNAGCNFPDTVNINELTTVAATAVLQDYIQFVDCSAIPGNTRPNGTCVSVPGAPDLTRMAGTVGNLVDVVTGKASDFLTAPPASTSSASLHVTLEKVDTLANILAGCVNDAVPAPPSTAAAPACAALFSTTVCGGTDALGNAATTLEAGWQIAARPSVTAKGRLYALQAGTPVFSPPLTSATAPQPRRRRSLPTSGRSVASVMPLRPTLSATSRPGGWGCATAVWIPWARSARTGR